MIYNLPCTEVLPHLHQPDMIFADPPDNIGAKYDEYKDKLTPFMYYVWFESWLRWSLKKSPIVWVSYYWQHDVEIKYMVRQLLKYWFPTIKVKTFLWRYTFGQHNSHDCGSGFRYLLRFTRLDAVLYPDSVRVTSERQRMGDDRANPAGRVPDDVWDIPRVTGNSPERRAWHPTQHPEALLERIIKLSTVENDTVVDLFGGTFTTHRVAQRLNRKCISCETSTEYCLKGAAELDVEIRHDPL